jgi:glycogen debranching enzyme
VTDAGPWTPVAEPPTLAQHGGLVTLVEGSTFSLSDRTGDIAPGGPAGVFVLDARVISEWQLLVDGQVLEPLSVDVSEPFAATFVARAAEDSPANAGTLLAVRRRWVGSGMREEIELRSYRRAPVSVVVELRFASDFADVFEVKAGHASPAADLVVHPDGLGASAVRSGVRREVRITERVEGDVESAKTSALRWNVTVPAKGSWQTCVEVTVTVADRPLDLLYQCGQPPAASRPALRLAGWRRHAPALNIADPRLVRATARAVDDVGSLVIEDPGHPESPVVAAGAPWFMALFGRDSLLTSYMSLVVDPVLAIGVLQTLARLQGSRENLATEEQPGRILHEVRFNSAAATDIDDGHIYYGTADATPLFVVLVGELARWGVDRSIVDELLPNVDRALDWIATFGDSDGDGYVEYERLSPTGLANQGWKDSWDGISGADGTLATTPIALAEVQGYVYAAYLARVELASARADDVTARRYEAKAEQLRTAFNRDFWLADRNAYAIALDGSKRPVDAVASNMGHCLWSGIVHPARAHHVVAHLMSAEMCSGWGLRTLATSMARFDALSYHNGSVWPHDTALAAAGLMRYGFVDESVSLIEQLLDAAEANDGRLPELYAGLSRTDIAVPVAYPSSCSPQAWASAAPLLMLRTLLRLQPRRDIGRYVVSPVAAGRLVDDVELSFAGERVRVQCDTTLGADVSGLPADVAVETEPPRPQPLHIAPTR